MSQNDEAPKSIKIPSRVDITLTPDHHHMLTLLMHRLTQRDIDLLMDAHNALTRPVSKRGRPQSSVTTILTHLITIGLMESLKAHGFNHLLQPRSSEELLSDHPTNHNLVDLYKNIGELVLLNKKTATPPDD